MQPVTFNGGFHHIMEAMQANQTHLSTSMERLSTGVRVNRAEDDAVGHAVAERWRAQQMGLEEAVKNIQQAQAMMNVAQDGLNTVSEALQRIRALAVRGADDSLNDDDRGKIQREIAELIREIDLRSGGPYTMYEVTNNGGPGFFDVNRVNITTTGTSYAGSVSSSAAVTEGIDTAATIASANFAGAKATQGTITVRKGGVTADLDWNKNLTTVQDVLASTTIAICSPIR